MDILNILNHIIVSIIDPLWTYFLIFVLILVGLYFSISTSFVQVRYFVSMSRLLKEGLSKDNQGQTQKGQISSFESFAVSIAGRVGTGNIVGIATAIVLGGPGAIFWMWVIALLGMASGFVESVLAQIYKQKEGNGFVGGPAYYIERGLGQKKLGHIFAVLTCVTFSLVFNMVQANTITGSLKVYNINPVLVGVILAFLTAVVIFGGRNRIAKVSSIFVPITAIFYVILTLVVILTQYQLFPSVVKLIFSEAFSGQAVAGGIMVVMMQGVKRGLFTNEAGMGSAPHAAASAVTSHPVKQGLIQAFSVFTDSMIICSCSAFMILVSGLYTGGLIGIELTQASLFKQMGEWGNILLIIAIFTFAYTTIIGNYFYGESNIKYLKAPRLGLFLFRVTVVVLVFLGSIAQFSLVWNLADLFMALMTMVNLYAIIRLFPQVRVTLKDFDFQIKEGKDPVFKARVLKDFAHYKTNAWDA